MHPWIFHQHLEQLYHGSRMLCVHSIHSVILTGIAL
nr:MAG TPA: PUA-like domain [Caudoviricetes sp.]